jgi:DNA-binding HxlR family transcriptional regulator
MRRVYASVPPEVEYWLTPLGCTLGGLVDSINQWAMTHIDDELVAQHEFDQRAQAVVEEN